MNTANLHRTQMHPLPAHAPPLQALHRHALQASPSRQRGVALAVILILLLVMTLLGLASLRGTLMEEGMSAGSYDRNLSFQAAEAALREAEARIAANPATACGPPTPGIPCVAPNTANPEIWIASPDCKSGAFINATALPANSGANPVQARYATELMGKAPPPNNPGCGRDGDPELCEVDYYRVTACSGDPAAGRAMTILQSNYVP